MGLIGRALGWLWPPKVHFVELEDLQLRLLRLLLWLFFALCAYLLFRSASFPTPPVAPLIGLWAFILTCLIALSWRPRWRRRVLLVLMIAAIAVVYHAGQYWGRASAPGIVFLSALGIFTTLLDGPRSGNAITVLSLAVMVLLRRQYPVVDAREAQLWANVFSCTVIGQLVGIAFFNVFGRVQAQLNDQAERLSKAEEDRIGLTRSLMQGLRPRLNELEQAVKRRAPGLGAVRQAAMDLAGELTRASGLRHSLNQIDDHGAAVADLAKLQRRFMNAMLWVAILTLLAAVAHNASHGNGLVAEPALVAVALMGLMAWLRKRDVEVARINRGLLLLYLLLFVKGIYEEGALGLPPTLPFLPNLVVAAALLAGTGFSLLFVAVGFAAVTWIWTEGTLALPDRVMLQNLLAILSILSVICHQVWKLHHGLLLQLEVRAIELGASMRQRRRLLGTIFHDISNPLAVIMGQLQLDAAGVPAQAQDRGRIESMADRIRRIVDHAETFLLQESAVPDEKMQAVEVAQLFADTQDLFEARLRAKRQHLTFASPGGLKVLGLPEVIRDSVLSNLVSNALKFSQTAAGLALEAIEQRDEVALVVRDTGPGIPEDVLLALHRRQSVISREGSGGEQGQGLGLSLVQEHLQRLGGRLELKRLPGGGTEARAWLKKA